ncbi:hypothetical protein HYY72_04460 [Candidatus Woesearchaeota archaeon]|nr:hypothetical protein [Candidatus Woesearchaeota archaeon]
MNADSSKLKRTFRVIRIAILRTLLAGQQTINQIATKTGINWRTVELHLTYLSGKGFCREIFSSQYVRIFEITGNGRATIENELKLIRERTVIETEQSENDEEGIIRMEQ